jgi:tRNA/tmRNA/rRNA uracil-C5-methylase (TrmA/RlmC/RlmD family)
LRVSSPSSAGKGGSSLANGQAVLEERIGEVSLRYGPASFFQVNTSILPLVLADMKTFAGIGPGDRLADLYSGVGTLGLALAARAKELLAVEPEPSNIEYLKANAARNKTAPVKIHDGTAEEWAPLILEQGADWSFSIRPQGPAVSRRANQPAGGQIAVSL